MLKKLMQYFNPAVLDTNDKALELAVKTAAERFHLQAVKNASTGLQEPLVNVDGLDRYAFVGATKLGLPARVLANTLHSEVLKHLPQQARNSFANRLTITAPVRSAANH